MLIIVNPAAGRSRSSRRWFGRVVAALEREGCTVVVREAGPLNGNVERLAREAEPEFDVIAAAGGDGTLNAVVNGAAPNGRTLALLPLGTANVLAREIGLPHDTEQLAALLANAAPRPIWPGRAGDRLFVTMASAGFDLQIVAAVDPGFKQRFGRLAFAWAIACCLWRYRPAMLTVAANGHEYRAAAMVAAKGRFYAGSYVIAPQADLTSPNLILVLFERSGRTAILRYLAAMLLGRLHRAAGVMAVPASEAVVSAQSAIPVQADGEIVGDLPMRFGVATAPLSFIRR